MASILSDSSSDVKHRYGELPTLPGQGSRVHAEPCSPVWRRVHLHSAREESHGLLGIEGKSVHLEWRSERCQRRGDIFRPYDACVWQRGRLRRTKRQVHGTEEGEDLI